MTMTEQKVSSVVQGKLMPGEVVIGQTRSAISDLVATDKRILKFSSNSFEAIDNTDITDIIHGTSKGRKTTSRILVIICAFLVVLIIIGIWAAYSQGNARNNVSLPTAILVTIVCVVFAFLSLTAVFTFDYGYYQIESTKIEKNSEKYWRIMRPIFGAKKIDEFFKSLSQQTGKPINKKK